MFFDTNTKMTPYAICKDLKINFLLYKNLTWTSREWYAMIRPNRTIVETDIRVLSAVE